MRKVKKIHCKLVCNSTNVKNRQRTHYHTPAEASFRIKHINHNGLCVWDNVRVVSSLRLFICVPIHRAFNTHAQTSHRRHKRRDRTSTGSSVFRDAFVVSSFIFVRNVTVLGLCVRIRTCAKKKSVQEQTTYTCKVYTNITVPPYRLCVIFAALPHRSRCIVRVYEKRTCCLFFAFVRVRPNIPLFFLFIQWNDLNLFCFF